MTRVLTRLPNGKGFRWEVSNGNAYKVDGAKECYLGVVVVNVNNNTFCNRVVEVKKDREAFIRSEKPLYPIDGLIPIKATDIFMDNLVVYEYRTKDGSIARRSVPKSSKAYIPYDKENCYVEINARCYKLGEIYPYEVKPKK